MKNRFIAHNHPKNKGYTKRYQPWEILVTEPFETKALAMERERQLKTAKGREFVWQQVKLKYER